MSIYGRSTGSQGVATTSGQTSTYALRSREYAHRTRLHESLVAMSTPSKSISPWAPSDSERGVEANEPLFCHKSDLTTVGARAYMDAPAVFSTYSGLALSIDGIHGDVTSVNNEITIGAGAAGHTRESVMTRAVAEALDGLQFVGVAMAKEELHMPPGQDETVPLAVRTAGLISIENTCETMTTVGDFLAVDADEMVKSALNRDGRTGRHRMSRHANGHKTRRSFHLKRITGGQTARTLRQQTRAAYDPAWNPDEQRRFFDNVKELLADVPIFRVVRGAPVGEMMDVLVM